MAATFVGRAEEKAALEQLWASARAGSGPVAAVIVGDPGAGKSRLLSEFTLGVGIDEQIHTSGHELERRIPLATAQVLMRRLRTIHGDGDTVDAVAFGSTTTSGSVDPVRLFEAAHRALMSMGPRGYKRLRSDRAPRPASGSGGG